MRTSSKATLLGLSAVLALITAAVAAVPPSINYQGYLTGSGGTPVNSATSMTFSLYSTPSGAGPVWNSGVVSVTPVNGIYSVELGKSPQPLLDPAFDRQYWLGVKVGADPELRPLQPLTSVPFALRAKVADSLNGGSAVSITNQISTSVTSGTAIQGASITGDGISGSSSGSATSGLYGVSSVADGYGVFGRNTATLATGYLGGTAGVYGQRGDGVGVNGASTSNTGVWGSSSTSYGMDGSSTSGTGVRGRSDSGPGVYGVSTSNTGVWGVSSGATGVGVDGLSNSAGGIGVLGRSTNGIGVKAVSDKSTGIWGISLGTGTTGIDGLADGTGSIGIKGRSAAGIGVNGISTSNTGVWGSSSTSYGMDGSSTSGTGVRGRSTSGLGVYGVSNSNTGVWGVSLGTSATGVDGLADGAGCIGVKGRSAAGNGVKGISTSSDGVVGSSAASGVSGVYGVNSISGGYGVFGRNTAKGTTGYIGGANGVEGNSTGSYGVYGGSSTKPGVVGESTSDTGVWGISNSATAGVGVDGLANSSGAIGVRGRSTAGTGVLGWTSTGKAGWFQGTVRVDGDIYATRVRITSDERFKKNIEPLRGALDKISLLQGVSFDWRAEEYPERRFDNRRQVGLIAQAVERVVPEVVATGEGGFKSVEYANLVGVLVEAVKELKAQNERLRLRVEALERNKQ